MHRLVFLLLTCLTVPCFSQSAFYNYGYDWPSVTTTGQLGISLGQNTNPKFQEPVIYPPRSITISWTVAGTAPSACTFRVEGSADGTTWFGLDATAPAADTVACTTANMISIVDRPVRVLRVYIVSYTQGDNTTAVKFSYTRGQ